MYLIMKKGSTGGDNCDDGHPGNGPCNGEQTCDGPYTCNKAKNVCCPVRLINTGVYMCNRRVMGHTRVTRRRMCAVLSD